MTENQRKNIQSLEYWIGQSKKKKKNLLCSPRHHALNLKADGHNIEFAMNGPKIDVWEFGAGANRRITAWQTIGPLKWCLEILIIALPTRVHHTHKHIYSKQ